MEKTYHLMATAAAGLESLVGKELERLGYDPKVENYRVRFDGTVVYGQIPDAQLHFPTLVGLYKTLRQHYSPQQLVRASDVIFADDRLSQTNVSLQTRFEKMVLEIAMALGE